ncbi:hypothetical protein LINGRAHAP2_LOCUS27922 [Linum grandiflorum]
MKTGFFNFRIQSIVISLKLSLTIVLFLFVLNMFCLVIAFLDPSVSMRPG